MNKKEIREVAKAYIDKEMDINTEKTGLDTEEVVEVVNFLEDYNRCDNIKGGLINYNLSLKGEEGNWFICASFCIYYKGLEDTDRYMEVIFDQNVRMRGEDFDLLLEDIFSLEERAGDYMADFSRRGFITSFDY